MLLSRRALLSLSLTTPLATTLEGCKKRTTPELVYVSLEGDASVCVLDPERREVVQRIPVGNRPRGLRLSKDGKLLFVALTGSPRGGPGVDESTLPPGDRTKDGIGVVDLASGKLSHVLPSGQDPETFDLSLDGTKLYISNEETSELSEVDIASKKVVRRVTVGGEPEGVTLRPDGRVVYVTSEEDGTVAAVDTTQFNVIKHIKVGGRPRSIAFASNGVTGFVTNELDASVTVFDARNNEPTKTIPLGAPSPGAPSKPLPMGAVLSPNKNRLFISTGRGGGIIAIDPGTLSVAERFDTIGKRPWGIGVSRDGKRIYTANGPGNDVSIVDAQRGVVLGRIPVGSLPWGIAVS